ncbi:MAG: hypothetical protein IJT63_00655, partial [Lachnospiraceae bacterium]|nr:hypothetical protein [Lachnospiraceae bacterium]
MSSEESYLDSLLRSVSEPGTKYHRENEELSVEEELNPAPLLGEHGHMKSQEEIEAMLMAAGGKSATAEEISAFEHHTAVPEPEPGPVPELGLDIEPEPVPELELDIEPEPVPKLGLDIEPEPVPDIEPEPVPELGLDIEPEPVPELGLDIEPEPVPDIEPEPVPELELD